MFKKRFLPVQERKIKRKLLKGTISFLAVLNVAMLSVGISAEAATFTHSHGGSCYGTESFTCSNHSITSYSEVQTLHCPNCLVQTSHTVTGYGDRCNNGLIGDVPVAYKEQCNVCGYARKDDPVSLNGPHTSTRSVLICRLPAGNLANVSMSGNTGGWTNQPVVLSVSVNNAVSGFSLAAAPYNFGQGYTSSNSISVTANGTYSASVKASDGSVVSVSCAVNNIDMDAPALSLSKSTDKWTEQGLSIVVSASDNASGLAASPYSFNGGAYTANSSFPVTTNGTYSVSVKDNAGNVRTGNITVSNIGRDPEVVAKEKAEEEARIKAEEEAKKKAEEEAKKKAEEEAKLKAEEEARIKAEEEAKKKAEEAKKKAEEEAKRKAEEEAKQKAEEAAKQQAEEAKNQAGSTISSAAGAASSTGSAAGGNSQSGSASQSGGTSQAGNASQSGSTSQAGNASQSESTSQTGSTSQLGNAVSQGTASSNKIPVKDATGNYVSPDKQLASIGASAGNGGSSTAGAENSDGLTITSGTAGTLSGLLQVTDTTMVTGQASAMKENSDQYASGNEDFNTHATVSDGLNTYATGSDGLNSYATDTSNAAATGGMMGEASFVNTFLRSSAALVTGIVLLATGGLVFLNLNYVYTLNNGKVRLVSTVRVKRSDKRIILYISENKLTRNTKYKVYLSPINKYAARDKRMYVMIMERDVLLNVDEGIGFTY